MTAPRIQSITFAMCLLLASTVFVVPCMHASEKTDWRDATNANTIAAYQLFIQRRPKSKAVPTAMDRIKALKWRDAEAANDPETYRAFAAEYPTDPNAAVAETRAAKLAADQKLDDEQWEAARNAAASESYTAASESYNEYLRLAPNGRHRKEAFAAIDARLLPRYINCMRSCKSYTTSTESHPCPTCTVTASQFGNDCTRECDAHYPGYQCEYSISSDPQAFGYIELGSCRRSTE